MGMAMDHSSAGGDMDVDPETSAGADAVQEAVPRLPSPPVEPPSVDMARESHCKQLVAGTEWVQEETTILSDSIEGGAVSAQSLEELVSIQEEWQAVRAK